MTRARRLGLLCRKSLRSTSSGGVDETTYRTFTKERSERSIEDVGNIGKRSVGIESFESWATWNCHKLPSLACYSSYCWGRSRIMQVECWTIRTIDLRVLRKVQHFIPIHSLVFAQLSLVCFLPTDPLRPRGRNLTPQDLKGFSHPVKKRFSATSLRFFMAYENLRETQLKLHLKKDKKASELAR